MLKGIGGGLGEALDNECVSDFHKIRESKSPAISPSIFPPRYLKTYLLCSPCALLVGMQIAAAAMGNSIEVSPKFKARATI